jgi:dTDP-4-dehydrorhamnose 3,5-epimerase
MLKAERLITTSGKELRGPLLLTPQAFADDRGWFFESWNGRVFAALLEADGQDPGATFVQDNHSYSSRGVLRGLHLQLEPHAQGKLVRCTAGSIFDVAVDIRPGSNTYGLWVGTHLSASNRHQLWIPTGFAHGFLSLCDGSEVLYKTTATWNRDSERSIHWADPQLAIAWPLEDLKLKQPLLAAKDATAPRLDDLRDALSG